MLQANPLLSAVACAVVCGDAGSWTEIADQTTFSVRTVQAAPRRFAGIIRDGLGLPSDTAIGQSHLYLWLGTRREFIRSWCRLRSVHTE